MKPAELTSENIVFAIPSSEAQEFKIFFTITKDYFEKFIINPDIDIYHSARYDHISYNRSGVWQVAKDFKNHEYGLVYSPSFDSNPHEHQLTKYLSKILNISIQVPPTPPAYFFLETKITLFNIINNISLGFKLNLAKDVALMIDQFINLQRITPKVSIIIDGQPLQITFKMHWTYNAINKHLNMAGIFTAKPQNAQKTIKEIKILNNKIREIRDKDFNYKCKR